MTVEFTYTIEQTKDCINDTEQQLRDLISTILSRKYGPGWEYSSPIWDKTTCESLEQRRQKDQACHPYQIVSQRLLDYSDIIDLLNIIEKCWDLFGNVFQSEKKVKYWIASLPYMRNDEMHGRPDISPHQKHLCLGICGEILTAIDHWSHGYEHAIKGYLLGLRIPVYVKNGNEIVAQKEVDSLAQQWVEKVCSKIGVKPRELSVEEGTKAWQVSFQHTHVRVTMKGVYPVSDFRVADITIKTMSTPALSRVIEAGEYPYWLLYWTLKDDLGPSTVATQVFTRTGMRPVSSTAIRAGEVSLLTHVEFRVGETDGKGLSISKSSQI